MKGAIMNKTVNNLPLFMRLKHIKK